MSELYRLTNIEVNTPTDTFEYREGEIKHNTFPAIYTLGKKHPEWTSMVLIVINPARSITKSSLADRLRELADDIDRHLGDVK